MNKFEALKLDDSNNGDSTDEREEDEEDEEETKDDKGNNQHKQNGDNGQLSEEEENRRKIQEEIEEEVPVVGEGEHPIQSPYAFWFSRRSPGKHQTPVNYEQNIKLVGKFASVEQFWNFYSYLVRPGDLSGHADIHLFKDGIKPMWEDDANKNGGKWIVRLKKGLASRCWENLILAMLGEQFMVGNEICGAVISVRFQEDIISIWNKTANDPVITGRIRDTFKRVLNLPPNTIMEYKTHNDSLKDNSSFRNTDVFLR